MRRLKLSVTVTLLASPVVHRGAAEDFNGCLLEGDAKNAGVKALIRLKNHDTVLDGIDQLPDRTGFRNRARWHGWPVVACGGMSIGHKVCSSTIATTSIDLLRILRQSIR